MNKAKEASLIESLVPILSLVIMLGFSVYFFGSDSSYGPNQIALIFGAAIASLVAIRDGHLWQSILESIVEV